MPATRYDMIMEQGATFRRILTIKQNATDLLSLVGYTARAQMRVSYDAPAAAGVFSCTINTSDSTITVAMTADQTDAIAAGRYVYDLEMEDQSGNVTKLMEGVIQLRPGVTR